MSDLSLMILCGRSPRHLYVADRLCKAGRPLAIVQETGGEWSPRKVLKSLRPDRFSRKIWRALRDRRRVPRDAEARFFFGDHAPQFSRPELLVEVPHINHPNAIQLARRLNPDLVAVFGTSLLRGPTLQIGRLGIVNLHGGLSPAYRGADCTFWALYNGEPEQVGCTLHFIDAGIDTGNLIAHVCPEIHEGDDELPLFWRSVREAAEVYAEFIERLGRGEQFGQTQPGRGHLYQVRQRTWRHERELSVRLAHGLLAGTKLARRIRWFPKEVSQHSPPNDETVQPPNP